MEDVEEEASPPKKPAVRRGRAQPAPEPQTAKTVTPKTTRTSRRKVDKSSPLKSPVSTAKPDTPKEPKTRATRGKAER